MRCFLIVCWCVRLVVCMFVCFFDAHQRLFWLLLFRVRFDVLQNEKKKLISFKFTLRLTIVMHERLLNHDVDPFCKTFAISMYAKSPLMYRQWFSWPIWKSFLSKASLRLFSLKDLWELWISHQLTDCREKTTMWNFLTLSAPTVGLSIGKWMEYIKGIKRQLPATSQVISLRPLWTLEILIFWHQRKNSLRSSECTGNQSTTRNIEGWSTVRI